MQLFSSPQFPWPNAKPTPAVLGTRPRMAAFPSRGEGCGWFDSSFDLTQGLDVNEQDCDTLYQLWRLAQG